MFLDCNLRRNDRDTHWVAMVNIPIDGRCYDTRLDASSSCLDSTFPPIDNLNADWDLCGGNASSKRSIARILLLVFLLLPMNGWAASRLPSANALRKTVASAQVRTEATELPSTGGSVLRTKISPFTKLGFQRMGLDLRVPTPFTFSTNSTGAIGGGSIVLTIHEANLWVGEGGLDISWSQRLGLFLKGSGNLMQRLALSVAPELVDATTLTEWRKNDLRWVALEGGAEYALRSPFSLIVGLRWDHFLLAIKEPLRTEGDAPNAQTRIIPNGADLQTDFIIPYGGITLQRDGLKGQIIGSILPYSAIQLRTRFSSQIGPSGNVAGLGEVNFVGLGGFLEAGCNYSTKMLRQLSMSFWGRAGILAAHGIAGRETSYTSTMSGIKIEGASSDRTLNFFRYNFTGGISLEALF